MIIFPNSKINIGLDILKKREDGFHEISSCFYPIQWTDILEIIPETTSTAFQSSGIPIPSDGKDNICLRAYQLLSKYFRLPPIGIHLHKIVPIGAGLGGGSADAAFMLHLMNIRFNLELSTEDLEDFARKLGSDCAFFIQNKPLYCFEKGDRFESIPLSLKGKSILLVYPALHISTQEAYSRVKPQAPEMELKESIKKPIEEWKYLIKNDFEFSLFPIYPQLKEIKEQLYQAGALYASMTGSGSCLYGIFEKEIPTIGFNQQYQMWKGILD